MNNAGIAAVGLISLAIVATQVWAIVDVVRRPAWAFEQARVSRTLWLVFLVVGIFLCNLGFFAAVFYLIWAAPKVRNMQQLGPGIGFPDGRPR